MNQVNDRNGELGRHRFVSLRTKFILFISLIITGVCSGLSWYVVQQQAEFMAQALTKTGHEGQILVAKSKGRLNALEGMTRSPDQPLYPDPSLTRPLLHAKETEPVITQFTTKELTIQEQRNRGKAGTIPVQLTRSGELLFNFAVLVREQTPALPLLGLLALEAQEDALASQSAGRSSTPVFGVVQVGLTNAYMLQALNTIILNIVLITFLIIFVGIAATTLLANRIVNPLRNLSQVARRIAEGDLTVSAPHTTQDEIGQLTQVFNQMTKALQQRDQAISSQIVTITKQVKELTTLNQTGSVITSTLDMDRLLTTVLQILKENLGFERMVLTMYDQERQLGVVSRVAGLPKEMEEAARQVKIPVRDDGGIDTELFIHGKPVLVENVELVADRMYPPALGLLRQIGVISFVAAPLKSKERVLGYLGADRGNQRRRGYGLPRR